MRNLAVILMVALFAVPTLASAGEKDVLKQAEKDARAWLAHTDGGKYAESWKEASTMFQTAVAETDWVKQIRAARAPLGALKSRKRSSATHTRSLPGAPDGEYVVFQFETRFEKKKRAIETVTVVKDGDRGFRAAGYFIK